MIRFAVAVALVLLMTGCQFKTLELDEEWAPLELVSERPKMLAKGTISTTIGHTLYVADLEVFQRDYPEGSPVYLGLLKHEREHSRRQFKMGLSKWLGKYLTDTEFQYAEEQRGYYLGLTEPGVTWYPEVVARALAGYWNALGQKMVTYERALEWARAVQRGQWAPPE